MTDHLSEVREFLDDVVSGLTGMHVKAMQYQNEPHDPARVEALAQIPAGLIDRAQALSAQLAKAGEGPFFDAAAKPRMTVDKSGPKAKAKTASKR